MREILYKTSQNGEFEQHGLFHGFFPATCDWRENFGNYTIAIIEKEDGTILDLPTDWIKFTDKLELK